MVKANCLISLVEAIFFNINESGMLESIKATRAEVAGLREQKVTRGPRVTSPLGQECPSRPTY